MSDSLGGYICCHFQILGDWFQNRDPNDSSWDQRLGFRGATKTETNCWEVKLFLLCARKKKKKNRNQKNNLKLGDDVIM
jgi:hypothetical protein